MSPIDKKIARALEGAPKIITATVALMEELARVLTAEIEIVTSKKTDEHVPLLKHKQRLAVDYRSNMKAIAAHPELLKNLTEEGKKAVRDMSQRLAAAADANARMLRGAVEATRQLIQNVVTTVRSEALQPSAYKNHKKAHMELGNYSPTCRPVAISRTV